MERGFWIAVAVVTAIVLFILLQPAVEDTFSPQPEAAWVAIQVDGDEVARVGQVDVAAGTKFRLHAVVGARGRGGDLVYYTKAQRLVLGGEEIDPERLRTWDRARTVKLRWYTVEGRWPFLRLESAEGGIQAFQMQEFLQADWPFEWTVRGEIDAVNDDHLEPDRRVGRQTFGTQRFLVRFQLYTRPDDLVPSQSISSWGVDELKEHVDEFPTVRAALPGRLGPASKVFGLTQLVAPPDPSTELRDQIRELADHGIAFSRLTLLRDQVADAGITYDALTWRVLDLDGAGRWRAPEETNGDLGVAPGDLVRVGDRVVVLYQDLGEPGVVDYEDLCFDFVQGAEIRSLGDVFSGGGLTVETASLPSP